MTFYMTLIPDSSAAAAAEALGQSLEALGYMHYDPFPGGAGPARIWKERVTAFAAPARGSWVRIIGQAPTEALAAASARLGVPLLYVWLTGEMWGYLLFQNGNEAMDAEDLGDMLRAGCTPDDVREAVAGNLDAISLAPIEEESAGALPDDVVVLAAEHEVDMSKAERMIDKYAGKIFAKLDRQGETDQAARDAAIQALQGGPSIWETSCGKRLRAFTACLALPEGWHRPALADLREAHTVVRRKTQNPNASLLPGDERALQSVPDAGDYIPIYYGIPQ